MGKQLINTTIGKIAVCVLYTMLCWTAFYLIAMPKVVENRSQHLGLLQYNSKVNKMVEKDSLHISGWDLYYLKKGSFDGYNGQ